MEGRYDVSKSLKESGLNGQAATTPLTSKTAVAAPGWRSWTVSALSLLAVALLPNVAT